MVICLERGANELHMVHLTPLPPHLCFRKIPNGLPFCCRLTLVLLEQRPLKESCSSLDTKLSSPRQNVQEPVTLKITR